MTLTVNKGAWQDSLHHCEARLERFTIRTADGEYIGPKAPARLVKHYDWLICYGLERGWVELSEEGALV